MQLYYLSLLALQKEYVWTDHWSLKCLNKSIMSFQTSPPPPSDIMEWDEEQITMRFINTFSVCSDTSQESAKLTTSCLHLCPFCSLCFYTPYKTGALFLQLGEADGCQRRSKVTYPKRSSASPKKNTRKKAFPCISQRVQSLIRNAPWNKQLSKSWNKVKWKG